MICIEDCIDRNVYRIRSRDLAFGVFRKGTGGFIGIREKFASLYLFEEYHHDNGAPYGTVTPEEDMGPLPPEIDAKESIDTGCSECGGKIECIKELRGTMDTETRNWTSWPWVCENGCVEAWGTRAPYKPLFDYLVQIDPGLARCEDCGEVITWWEDHRWDTEERRRPSHWSHIGLWLAGQIIDEADHEAIPVPV